MNKKVTLIIFGLALIVIALLIWNNQSNSSRINNVTLNEDNVVYVAISSPSNMRDYFSNNVADGFFQAHPVAAEVVLRDENADYLVHSSSIWPNHPGSTLGVVTEDEDVVYALVWAHVKATEFINDPRNEKKVIQYAMEFSGQDEDVIKESLKYTKHTEFPSKEATAELLKMMDESDLLAKSLEDSGYQSESDFFGDFLDEKYYKYIKDNPEWTPDIVETPVKLGYIESVLTYMTAYTALKEGYYSKVFTSLEIVPFISAPVAADALSAGLIDASYHGLGGSLAKRINEGSPIRIVGGGNAEGQSLVVKGDIKSAKDLVGRTILSSGPGTTPDFLLRMFLDSEGLKYELQK